MAKLFFARGKSLLLLLNYFILIAASEIKLVYDSRDFDKANLGMSIMVSAKPENTHLKGKYHCTTDLLFGWIGFDHTSKSVIN